MTRDAATFAGYLLGAAAALAAGWLLDRVRWLA